MAEFPVAARWAYFDHAAVAPLPRRAGDVLRAWAEDQEQNGVVHLPISPLELRWGSRNDLEALAELCGRGGIALFVDAIQGLGPLVIDVKRTPIDFLAADGHKWLLGPEGAGLLFIRRDWIERLRPIL